MAWGLPRGMRRPGWYIERSAMAHHVLENKLDVHTGGVDVQLSHSNSDFAQCEVHRYNCGHDIEQCKPCVHFLDTCKFIEGRCKVV